MNPKLRAFVPALLLALTVAPRAMAEPSVSDCLTASEGSLKLQREHHLREARSELLTCAAPSCPAEIRQECARKVDVVSAAIPTVVFVVTGERGQELSAVRVTMDGAVVAERLEGTALPVDPGSHLFTFEAAGQPTVTQTLIMHEGEHDRHEAIAMAQQAQPVVTVTPPPASSLAVASPGLAAADAPAPARGGARRMIGLAIGGAGAAGVVVGAVFGALATASWSTAQSECPSRVGCSPQAMNDRSSTQTSATVSTVGLVAGAALLAGGLTLYLTAPKDPARAVGLVVAPNGAGVGGSF
jgi:hypothetical protein